MRLTKLFFLPKIGNRVEDIMSEWHFRQLYAFSSLWLSKSSMYHMSMHFFPDFQSTLASHFSRSERLFRLQKAAAARNSSLHSAFFHVPLRVPQNHFPSFSTDGTQTSGLMVELLHDAPFPIFLSLVSAGGGKKTRNGKGRGGNTSWASPTNGNFLYRAQSFSLHKAHFLRKNDTKDSAKAKFTPSIRSCAISTQICYVRTLCVEFARIISLQKKDKIFFLRNCARLIAHNFTT